MSVEIADEALRYPIGRFMPPEVSPASRAAALDEIRILPARLRAAVSGLADPQLDTPYRDGGWTVRQLVHHLADANVNAYLRLKLALTELEPTIKVWDEERWAELPDAKCGPVEPSLTLLESLHIRWAAAFEALTHEDYEKTWRHPDRGIMTVDDLLALYAWHGRHHVAQITSLRERSRW